MFTWANGVLFAVSVVEEVDEGQEEEEEPRHQQPHRDMQQLHPVVPAI